MPIEQRSTSPNPNTFVSPKWGEPFVDQPWPVKVDDPNLQKIINETNYTPEEQLNIRGTLSWFGYYDLNRKRAFQTDDYKVHNFGFQTLLGIFGPEGMTPESIPDRFDRVIDIMAKGNRVWVRWIVEGHHKGMLFGIPGKGEPIAVEETALLTFVNGKISEVWAWGKELDTYLAIGGKLEGQGAVNPSKGKKE